MSDINAYQTAPPDDKPTRYRYFVVVCLLVIVFVAFFDRVNISILVANDAFLTDMGIKGQPVNIGFLMTAFLFSYGVCNITLSPLADYLGPRKISLLAIGLWVISGIIGGLAGSFAMMIAVRIMLGIGEGTQYPSQSTFVKNWFPPKERGRANAVWLVGQSLGLAGAMPVFAWIIGNYGWRPSFFVCAGVAVIPMILLWFYMTDKPSDNKRVNALELANIEEGLSKEATAVQTAEKTSFWDTAKVFIYNYRFWLLVLWTCCLSVINWGLVTWLPSYLKAARGFSWTQMGFMASLPFIIGLVMKIVGGWLSDRTGRSAPFCALAMIISALGVYFGATATNNMVSALLVCLGLGAISLGLPGSWVLCQGFAPGKAVARAAGIMNGVAIILGSLSPVAIGFFISLTGGYLGGLLFLVGTAVLGAVAALVLTYHKC
ncbi:MAG TPA: MFS transporter [Negativicutes bacterium]|nr:MFS transporter [Negativicutes bacterium]